MAKTKEETRTILPDQFISLEGYRQLEFDIKTDTDGIVQFLTDSPWNENKANFNTYDKKCHKLQYPDFLIDLSNSYSTTHGNFVELNTTLITGDGFKPETEDPALQEFLDNVNVDTYEYVNVETGEIEMKTTTNASANDQLYLWSQDMTIHSQGAMHVIWDITLTQIVGIKYLDVSKVRLGQVNQKTQQIEWCYVSPDWDDKSITPQKFPVYDPKNPQKSGAILFFKKNTPGSPYYALPRYRSGIEYIEAEHLLATFHKNQVKNNYTPSFIMEMIGSPSIDQKNEFKNMFKKVFQGVKNTAKILFNWIPDKTQVTNLIPIAQPMTHDIYNSINEIFIQKISTGWGATPDLAGVTFSGADLGGDSNKLFVSLYYYQKRKIALDQDIILRAFNKVIHDAGYKTKVIIGEKEFIPGTGTTTPQTGAEGKI